MESRDNLASRRQAIVVQGTVYTDPEIFIDTKVANLTNWDIHLSKDTKVSKCSLVPPMWLEIFTEEYKCNNVNAVQIYKDSRSKPEVRDAQYDTEPQSATPQEKR